MLQRLEFMVLLTKFIIADLSSFVISRNWLPSSYWSPDGSFLIHATFEIAFTGFVEFGSDISRTNRQASETNSFALKQTPPSLRFLVIVPDDGTPALRRFRY